MSRTYRYTYDLKYVDGKWDVENWSLEGTKSKDMDLQALKARNKLEGVAKSAATIQLTETIEPFVTIQPTETIKPSVTIQPTETQSPSVTDPTTPHPTAKETPVWMTMTPLPTKILTPTPAETPIPTTKFIPVTPTPLPILDTDPHKWEFDYPLICNKCGNNDGTTHIEVYYLGETKIAWNCSLCGNLNRESFSW